MIHSSILPKLLAKENITIQHGNYHTAWFDVKDRVLGLPMWKDMGKDVYDLLVGHEVSHALHTPFEGWHDSPEKLDGIPRSYINVVEDARIERFIQDLYPGLVGPMSRGYKVLKADDFFGDVDSMDWSELKLIDKINIKAKLGHLADVPFTSEEQVFFDRAMKTQTFADVVQLSKDILAFTKENHPEQLQPEGEPPQDMPQVNEDQEDDLPQGHDDMESEAGEDQKEQSNSKEENKSEEEKAEDEAFKENTEGDSEDEDDGKGEEEDTPAENSNQPEYQEDVSVTDEAYRKAEDRLLDIDSKGNQKVLINEIPKEWKKHAVKSYKTLAKKRSAIEEKEKQDTYNNANEKYDGYKAYVKQTKKSVNFAVKEFEQRKAAFQYTRATTAKTGRLDVNKLWSYKTSEDIFSQVTKLADAKNHGMIFLIDYSGSMHNSMPYVMDQVIHLVLFCKAVNIPFDVYGFTTGNDSFDEIRKPKDGDLRMDRLSMPHVCSSSLKKKDFDEALRHMYGRKNTKYHYENLCKYEEWGSTPLNQAIIVSHDLVKEFKIKNQVQKMNFIVFSDGDANGMNAYQSQAMESKKLDVDAYSGGYKAIIDGKIADIGSRFNATKNLLKNIQKRYQTKTIGFFMASDANHWRDRLWRLKEEVKDGESIYFSDWKKDCAKEYKTNKCIGKKDVFGYNQYYLLKGGKTLSAEDHEFKTFECETDSQIRSAFKKHAKSKKLNKVLMTSFGKEVA